MKPAGSVALLLALAVTAGAALAQKAPARSPQDMRNMDPAAIASDEQAFRRLREETQRRNAAAAARNAPTPRARKQEASACQYKPVMTEADLAACRQR